MFSSMLRFMALRNSPRNSLLKRPVPLGWQLAFVIVAKVTVLLLFWHLFLKEHKMQGHTEATAAYFLTHGATPQKQLIPRSPWE